MRLSVAALSLSLFAPLMHAVTITVGSSSGANVYPFSSYSGEYQQVYSAAAFSTPVVITGISFVGAAFYPGTVSGNFSIYLSTTSKAVNGLSTTYAANRGANYILFATGPFFTPGGYLGFNSTNGFVYDPAAGNLLLDFFNNGSTGTSPAFQAGVSADTSRVFNYGGNGAPTADNFGLQTTFTYTNAVSITPEPSSFVLLGTGCSALIGLVRRRRQL